MNSRGGVDLPYMEKILGKPQDDIVKALSSRVFEDPNTGQHVLAERYLAGDVRAKLAAAKAAGMKANIAALEAVQPKDLEPSQIDVRLGAPWVPASDVSDFIKELLSARGAVVRHLAKDATWHVELHGGDVANNTEWGVDGATAERMIEDALNQRPTQVMSYDAEGKPRIDPAKTLVAQEKQQQIKDRFGGVDMARPRAVGTSRAVLQRQLQQLRIPEYNGDHLTLPA